MYINDENLVLNQAAFFMSGKFLLACVVCMPIVIATGHDVLNYRLIKISEVKNYSIDKQRDIFNTFDTRDQNDQGLPLDPFDLMNRLKQAGFMENATTPSDALDEALNAFDKSEY